MTYTLGIDLGTTYSAAATAEDGRADIFTLGSVAPAIPSVVVLRSDGEVLVGEAADRRSITEPTRTGREFKRRLGDPAPLVLGGTPYGAEALMARLLRAIVDAVTERQGAPPARITVTHPANYGPYKKELLAEMVRLADVGAVDFVTEPEAAAISYAQQNRLDSGQIVAVYDFGGGTFDAAVLRKTPDGFEILGQPEGMERLGGIDFDQAIFAHVDDALGGQVTETDPSDPMARAALARLRADVRAAKESLSTDTDVTIPVMLPNLQTEVRLTRPEFEAMIRPRLSETVAALERAVRSAGIDMADVDRILLVGGSSRIPLVAETVRQSTGRPVAVDAHPKFAIALGAARAGMATVGADETRVVAPAPPPPGQPAPASSSPTVPAVPPTAVGGRAVGGGGRGRVLAVGAAALLLVGGAIAAFALMGGNGNPPGALASSSPIVREPSTSDQNPTISASASQPGSTPVPTGSGAGTVGTTAGTSSPGNGGDGGPAVAAQLGRASGVAIGPDGAIYISDVTNSNVRLIRGGTIETLSTEVYLPSGIEVDADGNVYVADTGNHRIVRIDPAGTLTVVAGGSDSEYGLGGDGGPAADALLYQPEDVALAPDGSLYISDSGNDRVRRVDASGIITTVAGTGAEGSVGDGGPAIAAQLDRPVDVEVDPDGNLYIADTNNGRIRRVDPDGVITSFAGIADGDFDGPPDGAVAAETSFYGVSELEIDGDGNVWANPVAKVVRIDLSGVVTHVAGAGTLDEDGVPAIDVDFAEVGGIAIDPDTGTLYVAAGSRVREVPGAATPA